MQKWLIVYIIFFLCSNTAVKAQDDYKSRVNNYIARYRDLAIEEQLRSGIPAAITLAQGIHETAAGASELSTEANNHFGIKCKKSWTGMTFTHTDDAPDECFRKYEKAEDSYKDHSDYLKTSQRYSSLFTFPPANYKAWAYGLKRCGYATNPHYASMLIRIIEDYELQQYTDAAIAYSKKSKETSIAKEIIPEDDAPENETFDASVTPPPYGAIVKVNGLKAVYAKKGDMPLEYAIKNNIRYEKLLEFNEIDEHPLQADMFLYLEKKRIKGLIPTHKVHEGETMAEIAQKEGIQLKSLRYFNLMKNGDEPAAGAVLALQKQTSRKPKLANDKTQASTTASLTATAEKPVMPTEGKAIATGAVVASASIAGNVALPAPDNSYIAKSELEAEETDITEEATAEVGPPASVNDIPAVLIEPEPPANKPEPAAEIPAEQTESSRPKSELDLLKSKFDKVVYAAPTSTPDATLSEENPEVPSEAAAPIERPAAGESKTIVVGHTTPTFYVVKKGDTAFSIAKAHGISVSQLQEWNGLNFDAIKVGQKLRVKQ